MLKKLRDYFIGFFAVGSILTIGFVGGYVTRPYAESMRFVEFMESVPSTRPVQESPEELNRLFPDDFSDRKGKIKGLEFEVEDLEVFQSKGDFRLRAKINGNRFYVHTKNKEVLYYGTEPKNITEVKIYKGLENK